MAITTLRRTLTVLIVSLFVSMVLSAGEIPRIVNKSGQYLELRGDNVIFGQRVGQSGYVVIRDLSKPRPIFMQLNEDGDWAVLTSKSFFVGYEENSKKMISYDVPILGGVTRINENGEWIVAASHTIYVGFKTSWSREVERIPVRIEKARAKLSEDGEYLVEIIDENGHTLQRHGRVR